MATLDDLIELTRAFNVDRDWDQFHSPKNLSMALAGEVGELLEVFQWLTEQQSDNLTAKQHEAASEEIADVFLYLVQLADRLDVDLVEVATVKLQRNGARYSVEGFKGSAEKARK